MTVVPAAEQIILAIGGKDTATLFQLIALNPVLKDGQWTIEGFQKPVDIPTPKGVTALPGQPPAMVYYHSNSFNVTKLITVNRVQPSGQSDSDYNAKYYAEVTFDEQGNPALAQGMQLPGASDVATSLLLYQGSISVLSQDTDVKGHHSITQPKLGSSDASSTADPATSPWTIIPFTSNNASPSPVKNPFARATFVPLESDYADIIVVETYMNTGQLSTASPINGPPDYSFNAYSMPTASFVDIQTNATLLWSEHTIKATAAKPDQLDHPILSSPAPLVVPVEGTDAQQRLYVFYSSPEPRVPFYYFCIPLSSDYKLISDGDKIITPTLQTTTTQTWPWYRNVAKSYPVRYLPYVSQLPGAIGQPGSNGFMTQSAVPVMVGIAGGSSAVFVFFLGANFDRYGTMYPGICFASQELSSDGSLDPSKWFYYDKMIPMTEQNFLGNNACLFTAVTVPATNQWFQGPADTAMIPMYH